MCFVNALHDRHERSTTTMSERRKTQASDQKGRLSGRDARIDMMKRVGRFAAKTLGILAIPGIPIAIVAGVNDQLEKREIGVQNRMHQELARSVGFAMSLTEALDPKAEANVFADTAVFMYTDKSGTESVRTGVWVDGEDNTFEISLGVDWSSTTTPDYTSSKSVYARFAVPAEQIDKAFADEKVSLGELKDIVGARTNLVNARTIQIIEDPSKDKKEVHWSNHIEPDARYKGAGYVTAGLQDLYKDLGDRATEVKNRPIGWFDKSQLTDVELKEYDAAEKAADYVKQGYPNLAEGILRQVDDAGKFTKADAGDMVDPELAKLAADYVKQGYPTLAKDILEQVDDAGNYTLKDARAVVDSAK